MVYYGCGDLWSWRIRYTAFAWSVLEISRARACVFCPTHKLPLNQQLASQIWSSIMPCKGQTTSAVFYFIHYNKELEDQTFSMGKTARTSCHSSAKATPSRCSTTKLKRNKYSETLVQIALRAIILLPFLNKSKLQLDNANLFISSNQDFASK